MSGRVEALDPATGKRRRAGRHPGAAQLAGEHRTVDSVQQTALVSTDATGAFQLPITPRPALQRHAAVENRRPT